MPLEQLGFDNSELFPVQPRLEGTRFPVAESPGLGVEFDETKAVQQECRFWRRPTCTAAMGRTPTVTATSL